MQISSLQPNTVVPFFFFFFPCFPCCFLISPRATSSAITAHVRRPFAFFLSSSRSGEGIRISTYVSVLTISIRDIILLRMSALSFWRSLLQGRTCLWTTRKKHCALLLARCRSLLKSDEGIRNVTLAVSTNQEMRQLSKLCLSARIFEGVSLS